MLPISLKNPKSYFNKSLSTREGVFLCGFSHGPMNISETVIDASGVASQVASTLKSVRHSLIKDKEIDILPEKDIIHITPMALIIGGGVSGMRAALNISQQGFKTYIVEKEKQLGGNLNYINTLYPINEKASNFLQRMEYDVKNNKNIQVFLNSKLKEIKGAIGNYEIKILNSNEKIYDFNGGGRIWIFNHLSNRNGPRDTYAYCKTSRDIGRPAPMLLQSLTRRVANIQPGPAALPMLTRRNGGCCAYL